VKLLKYRYVTDVAVEFVALVPDVTYVTLPRVDMYIPVPLHIVRLKARGFNQAEVLGDILAKRAHVPLETNILRRIVSTEPQVSLQSRVARLGNMKNVFGTVRTVRNAYIILFDDVFTTGATMRSAANALKRAGAKYVWAVTMAR
jgi:ComF family protein